MLACAVVTLVAFLAQPAPAQEPLKTPTKVVTASETVTVAPRTGLLGRMFPNRTTMVVRGVSATTMPPATTSGVTQAQGTTTTMAAQTQVVETRQGVLSRMRARLGR
jgi:hypothetical protein